LQRQDRDIGVLVLPVRRTGEEEHGFGTGQDLRPAMRSLTDFPVQATYRNSLSSLRWNLRQAGLLIESHDDVAVLTPTAAAAGRRIAQGPRLAAFEPRLLQFSLGEEPDPLPVRGKKRRVRPIGARHLQSLRLIQSAGEHAPGTVSSVRDKYEPRAIGREDNR